MEPSSGLYRSTDPSFVLLGSQEFTVLEYIAYVYS